MINCVARRTLIRCSGADRHAGPSGQAGSADGRVPILSPACRRCFDGVVAGRDHRQDTGPLMGPLDASLGQL